MLLIFLQLNKQYKESKPNLEGSGYLFSKLEIVQDEKSRRVWHMD